MQASHAFQARLLGDILSRQCWQLGGPGKWLGVFDLFVPRQTDAFRFEPPRYNRCDESEARYHNANRDRLSL